MAGDQGAAQKNTSPVQSFADTFSLKKLDSDPLSVAGSLAEVPAIRTAYQLCSTGLELECTCQLFSTSDFRKHIKF